MPKKKYIESSEEEEAEFSNAGSENSESEEPVKKSKSSKSRKAAKEKKKSKRKQKSESEEENESEDEAPRIKKPRLSHAKKPSSKVAAVSPSEPISPGTTAVKTNPEGDKYIDLGKKKRATVRAFKGAVFVDIREFYGEGDEKPGKKGISLSREQWEALKEGSSAIDKLFDSVTKK